MINDIVLFTLLKIPVVFYILITFKINVNDLLKHILNYLTEKLLFIILRGNRMFEMSKMRQ